MFAAVKATTFSARGAAVDRSRSPWEGVQVACPEFEEDTAERLRLHASDRQEMRAGAEQRRFGFYLAYGGEHLLAPICIVPLIASALNKRGRSLDGQRLQVG